MGFVVVLDIFKDSLVSDISAGRAEIAPAPESPAPVPFTQLRKFHLNLTRRPPFHALHEMAHGDMRRNLHKHMNVISTQNTTDNFYIHLCANLANNGPNTFADIPPQHFVTIFWNPNDMVAMVK